MQERYVVVVVGGGPVGVGLAVDLGLRGGVLRGRVAAHDAVAHPQGAGPVPVHGGALLVLGPGRRAAGCPRDAAGPPDRSGHGLRHPSGRVLARPARPRAGAAVLLPGQRAAAAVPHRAGPAPAAGGPAGGGPADGLDGDDGRAGRRGSPRPRCDGRRRRAAGRGRVRRRLRRRALAGAHTGRHRAVGDGLRRARRPGHVPLARAARGAAALPRALDLPRDAPGPRGLLDVLRPGRRGRAALLPRTGPARQSRGRPRRRRPPAPRRRVPVLLRRRPRGLLGPAGAGRRRVPGGTSVPRRRRRAHPPAVRLGGWIRDDRAVLERYRPELDREEFARRFEEVTKGFGRRLRDFEPHYEGSPVVLGPPGGVSSAHGSHVFTACAGHHLPPQPLSCGRDVFEVLARPGFTLLALDADDASVAAFEAAAGHSGVPLTLVRDSLAGGREAYGSRLVLVPPDQFVAWTGDRAPDDVGAVVARVAGRS